MLPVTSFAGYQSVPPNLEVGRRVAFLSPASDYLQRLHTLLSRMDNDWLTMSAGVARVDPLGDAHQTLLDIVGLHSGSVEYHQRYAESFDQLYNKLVMEGGRFAGFPVGWLKLRSSQLLPSLGADPNAQRAIVET